WLRSKRLSAEASSLKSACVVSMHRWTIRRLKRALDSSWTRRVLMTLGMSRFSLASSARMMNARSAWRKTWNRLSPILASSLSWLNVWVRSAVTSTRKASFSDGWVSRSCLLPGLRVASTVLELSSSCGSSSSGPPKMSRGSCGFGAAPDAKKMSQILVPGFCGTAGRRLLLAVFTAGGGAALEVFDVELVVHPADDGVLAADGGQVDDDVAVRVAAQHPFVAVIEGDHRPLVGPFEHVQGCHYHSSDGGRGRLCAFGRVLL